jgi:hypothetical protein
VESRVPSLVWEGTSSRIVTFFFGQSCRVNHVFFLLVHDVFHPLLTPTTLVRPAIYSAQVYHPSLLCFSPLDWSHIHSTPCRSDTARKRPCRCDAAIHTVSLDAASRLSQPTTCNTATQPSTFRCSKCPRPHTETTARRLLPQRATV